MTEARAEYLRQYRLRNKDKAKQWYLNNRERLNKMKSEYYRSHKEEHKRASKEYYWRHKEKISEKHKTRYHLPKYRFFHLKASAKQRGLMVQITLDDYTEITKNPCRYCGETGYGIDRIDSSLGYLINNCASCCKNCNYMKLNLTNEDFLTHIKKIYIHNEL